MAGGNAIESGNRYGGASFKREYDMDEIRPEAYAGHYLFQFLGADWKWTNTHPSNPMIMPEVKIAECLEEEPSEDQKKSVGVQLRDFIIIDNNSSGGNRGKAKLRLLRDKLGLDTDFSMMSPEIIKAFGDEIYGKTIEGWIVNRKQADGNVNTNIEYVEPRGARPAMPRPRAEEPDEEPEPEEESEEEPIAAKGREKPKAVMNNNRRR